MIIKAFKKRIGHGHIKYQPFRGFDNNYQKAEKK